MKKSGSHFKPHRSLLKGFNRKLTIIIVLVFILLSGALYGFIAYSKDEQIPLKSHTSQNTGGLTVSNQPTGSISLGNEPPVENEILKQINSVRKKNGVSPVSHSSSLDKSAVTKLDDMITRNYWAHNAPDGTEPWRFINQAGYKYRYAGENLWYGWDNSTVSSWLNSPTHKAVMLDGRYTDIGIAIKKASSYDGKQNVYVVVTHYASPLSGSTSTYTPSSNTSPTGSSSYEYRLPSYSSEPMPDFDTPSSTYTPPPSPNCGTSGSSYYSNCMDSYCKSYPSSSYCLNW